MAHSARSAKNATRSFSKELTMRSLRVIRNGRSTSSRPNRVTRIDVRLSLRLINRGLIGRSGSRPWLHPRNTHGRFISSGDSCTTIRAHFHCWRAIHSPLGLRTTFVRDSIAIVSRRRATQRGGNVNQSASGYPPCRSTTNNSAAFSLRWIGWIKRVLKLQGRRSRLPRLYHSERSRGVSLTIFFQKMIRDFLTSL